MAQPPDDWSAHLPSGISSKELWGFDRQTWPRKELVVVDSSPAPFASRRSEVRVITAPPGASVPSKRNLALAAARGEIVAWFDDDDWQHPERLTETASAVAAGASVAGAGAAWFVDLLGGGAYAYRASGGVIFNCENSASLILVN